MAILLIASNLLVAGNFNFNSGYSSPLKQNLIGYTSGISANLAADESAADEYDDTQVFAARPMLMSLIVPGLGQAYNKSPLWKTALFVGIEAAGIVTWWSLNNRAEDVKLEYKEYVNVHWSLSRWAQTSSQMNFVLFGNEVGKSVFTTTHHVTLIDEDGDFFPSDILIDNPGLADSMDVLKNRDFFENVGKYDQFLGGWDDAYDNGQPIWWETTKDVGDSTETVLMTKNKDEYLDMRLKNNDLLKWASYTVSMLMFNHVASAIEAVYTSQANAKRKKNVDADLGLIYDSKSKYGVAGLALSVRF